MLTPDEIAALQDIAAAMLDPVSDYLIRDVCERIAGAGKMTSTAAYELYRASAIGKSAKDLKAVLKKQLGLSDADINQLFDIAAQRSYEQEVKAFPGAQSLAENTSLQQTIRAAAALATEDIKNITQSLGFLTPEGRARGWQQAYQECMDYAFTQVFSGAVDYNTAIRAATKNLISKGIRQIDYDSGVHTAADAAARRCILGGIGLMVEQISSYNHDRLACNGWEISAHADSAPDHEPYQGRQYTDAEYTALNNSLLRRIGTLNCKHDSFPIIIGVNEPQYTEEQLRKFREDNAEGITYEGRHYTKYEATQMQRKVERSIRANKRGILAAEATGDKDTLLTRQIRQRRLNEEYQRFSAAAGLRTRQNRIEVAGWTRSDAAKANATVKAIRAESERLRDIDLRRQARLVDDPTLALPNADRANLPAEKFTLYLFNKENQRGYAKGIAFSKRLGYNVHNWEDLRDEIKNRAVLYPARSLGDSGYGMKYEQLMVLYGKKGIPANVVVGWIDDGSSPRMTSAYIKELKKHED